MMEVGCIFICLLPECKARSRAACMHSDEDRAPLGALPLSPLPAQVYIQRGHPTCCTRQ